MSDFTTAKAEAVTAKQAEIAAKAAEIAERVTLDLTHATQVQTPYGWYDVIAVNADTVTVSGDFDDFRIPKSKITEARNV